MSLHPCILEYIWICVTVYLLNYHPKYLMKIFNDYLSGNLVCGDGNCGGRYHRTDDCCRKPWWLFSKTLLLIELSIVEDKHINQCNRLFGLCGLEAYNEVSAIKLLGKLFFFLQIFSSVSLSVFIPLRKEIFTLSPNIFLLFLLL